jgi:RsiW-degrading membrane proteinase PrsW (M82 family)
LWLSHAVARILPFAHEPERTLLEAYLVSAALEETGKATCLYVLTRLHMGPGTRYGAFLYGLHAAAGLALAENVGLLFYTSDFESFTTRFVLRAYMASPMHVLAGGVLGYLWSRRRFDAHPIGLMGGVGAAILIHGTYNALLMAVERLPLRYEHLVPVCAALAMSIPLGGTIVLRVLAGRLRVQGELDGRPST